MRLPSDWKAERASGWWQIHHLIHIPCGLRTGLAYDLVCNDADARQVVYGHRCGDDEEAIDE
jgi:hypothetical protein